MAKTQPPAPGLAPGDVVILKSGGATLTITAIASSNATCVWYAKENEAFRTETLPLVALSLVDFADDEDEFDDED